MTGFVKGLSGFFFQGILKSPALHLPFRSLFIPVFYSPFIRHFRYGFTRFSSYASSSTKPWMMHSLSRWILPDVQIGQTVSGQLGLPEFPCKLCRQCLRNFHAMRAMPNTLSRPVNAWSSCQLPGQYPGKFRVILEKRLIQVRQVPYRGDDCQPLLFTDRSYPALEPLPGPRQRSGITITREIFPR